MSSPQLLHGVPVHEWIGRMMKSEANRGQGRHAKARHTVKFIGFNWLKQTAEVHPSGHRRTDTVPFSELLPWWSRNHDLRVKYKVDDQQEAELERDVMFSKPSFEAPQPNHEKAPTLETVLPDRITPDSPAPEKPAGTSEDRHDLQTVRRELVAEDHLQGPPSRTQQAMNTPSTATKAIKRIIVDPNASPTWMEDYKVFQHALEEVSAKEAHLKEAEHQLAAARDSVRTFAAALEHSGVTIEWEGTPEPEKELESHTALFRQMETMLLKQMVSGRRYNRQQIADMVGRKNDMDFIRDVKLLFQGHKKLRFGPPTRGEDWCYRLLP